MLKTMPTTKMLSREQIEKLKKLYPPGTCVKLLEMDDPQAVPVNTLGTVRLVDDIGSIHVNWETGSTLAIIPEVDRFEIINRRHLSKRKIS